MAAPTIDPNLSLPAGAPPLVQSPSTQAQHCHIAYLHSWPLVGQFGPGDKKVIDRLDFEEERKILARTFMESNKAIKLAREVATSENLDKLVTLGCRAIHYTGHGLPGLLAFEDRKGMMHALIADHLKRLISAGGRAEGVKFVFVSACHSKPAGDAFVAAGVPHVIAVKTEAQVADKTAHAFASSFYRALLAGKTVKAAFDIGRENVRAAPHVNRSDELDKFLLMPKNTDHEVAIFDDIPFGVWEDRSPPEVPNNLPVLAAEFRGRNFQLQEIVESFSRGKRMLTIIGPKGIGKSALAIAAAHYVCERRQFRGVFWIPMSNYYPAVEDLNSSQDLGSKMAELSVTSAASMPPATLSSPHGEEPLTGTPATSITEIVAEQLCNAKEDFKSLSKDLGSLEEDISERELLSKLRDKEYLFVFDGVDAFLSQPDKSKLSIRSFIKKLAGRGQNIKILATCEHGVGALGIGEFMGKALGPLSPSDAAQLFYHLAPRRIDLAEFGCNDASRAVQDLQAHKALQLLAGHPAKIADAVELLRDFKMAQLPEMIRKKQEMESKQIADKIFKNSSDDDERPRLDRPHSVPERGQSDVTSTRPPHLKNLTADQLARKKGVYQGPEDSQSSMQAPRPVKGSASVGAGGPPSQNPSFARAHSRAAGTPLNDAAVDELLCQLVPGDSGRRMWRDLGDKGMRGAKWNDFAGALQTHFLRNTGVYERPLEETDLEAMKQKYCDKSDVISLEMFARFWVFFRVFEDVVRRNQDLWRKNDPPKVYGLLPRADATRMVAGKPAGTFLLRFSLNNPGQIAVTYVDDKAAVQHVLIRMEEQGGCSIQMQQGVTRYHSLPDLILKCRPLSHLYPGFPKADCFIASDSADTPAAADADMPA